MPSMTERVNAQFQQQYGRPPDPNDPQYQAFIKPALERLIAQDKQAYESSKRKWGVADKIATGATLGVMGAGIGSALMGAGGAAGAAGSSTLPSSVEAASLGGIPGGAPWAITPYATTATMSAPGALAGGAGAFGGAAGAAGAKGLLGLSGRDWASLAPALVGTIGSAVSPKPNMAPTTATSDPNFQKLIATLQGRMDKSEPLYDSIMAMANGLLPTQYQKGGGGMG